MLEINVKHQPVNLTYLELLVNRTYKILSDSEDNQQKIHWYTSQSKTDFLEYLHDIIEKQKRLSDALANGDILAVNIYDEYYKFLKSINSLYSQPLLSPKLFNELESILVSELKTLHKGKWDVNKNTEENILHVLMLLADMTSYDTQEHYEFHKKWNASGSLEDYPVWRSLVENVLKPDSSISKTHLLVTELQYSFGYGKDQTIDEEKLIKFHSEKDLWSNVRLSINLPKLIAYYIEINLHTPEDNDIKRMIYNLNKKDKEQNLDIVKSLKSEEIMIGIHHNFLTPFLKNFVSNIRATYKELEKNNKIKGLLDTDDYFTQDVDKIWATTIDAVASVVHKHLPKRNAPVPAPIEISREPVDTQPEKIKKEQGLWSALVTGLKKFFYKCFGKKYTSDTTQPVAVSPAVPSSSANLLKGMGFSKTHNNLQLKSEFTQNMSPVEDVKKGSSVESRPILSETTPLISSHPSMKIGF